MVTLDEAATQESEVKDRRDRRGFGQPLQTKSNFLENPLDSKIVSQHFRGDAT